MVRFCCSSCAIEICSRFSSAFASSTLLSALARLSVLAIESDLFGTAPELDDKNAENSIFTVLGFACWTGSPSPRTSSFSEFAASASLLLSFEVVSVERAEAASGEGGESTSRRATMQRRRGAATEGD